MLREWLVDDGVLFGAAVAAATAVFAVGAAHSIFDVHEHFVVFGDGDPAVVALVVVAVPRDLLHNSLFSLGDLAVSVLLVGV